MSYYDLVILGGGTGGYVSAIRGSQLGMKVAIIEKGRLGGTCLHRGCIPSKSLLKSAEVYTKAKKSRDFGVEISNVALDFERVKERKNEIVEQLYRGIQYLMKKGNIDIIEGTGEITNIQAGSAKLVEFIVTNKDRQFLKLQAKHAIIATGSRPKEIPGLAIDGKKIIDSNHAMVLENLPTSIIIVGGGAIGIEWASMLSDFGVDVSIIETAERILPAEDEDISKEVKKLFKRKQINIFTSAKVLDSQIKGEDVHVTIEQKGKLIDLAADKVLVSVGRTANIAGIGLEKNKIDVNNHVINTNEYYQTSVPNIYAIGDVIGGLQLAHVALHEGLIAVDHIAGLDPILLDYQNVPKCIYSNPQVASVGLTEQEAIKAGYQVAVGKFPFAGIGKALIEGGADGFAKIIFDDSTKEMLGVHMVGSQVTDLISEAGLAKFLRTNQLQFSHSIRPHPTLSEIFSEATLDSRGIPIHI